MKKRTKRIGALLMTSMMLMSITACGSKDVSDVASNSESVVEIEEEVASDAAVKEDIESTSKSTTVNEEGNSKDAEVSKAEVLAENEKYLLTEKKKYLKDGSFYEGTKYEYNQIGTLIKTTRTDYELTETVVQEAETFDNGTLKVNINKEYGDSYSVYNEAGQLTESYLLYNGFKNDHYTYEYKEASLRSRMERKYDDIVCDTWVYEYNEHGDEVRCEMSNSEIGSSVTSYQYEYDEAGNKRVMECYADERVSYRREYDETGTLRAEIRYRTDTSVPAGTISSIEEYDSEGRKILYKSYSYDNPEMVSMWIISEYSEDGKNKTEITCDSNGNPVSEETSYANYEEYDAEGNLIRTFESTSAGYRTYQETNYDTNGNIISIIYCNMEDDGSISKSYRHEYEYDENNNLVKETEINPANEAVSWYEYTYGKYAVAK